MTQQEQPRHKDKTMKSTRIVTRTAMVALLALLCACAPAAKSKTAAPPQAKESETAAQAQRPLEPGQLPVRFQQPSYVLKESASGSQLSLGETAEIKIPIGADISSTTGPVELRDILKRLAALKKMNISWASDVDQHAMVDVDIRAEDDFFEAIDNVLRQVDYYHEVKGNTIVVKYRETRKFHVAMPFMVSTYSSGVGGDVLGASGIAGQSAGGNLVGKIQLTSNDNKFDIWTNIQKNLDQTLGIWEEAVPAPAASAQAQPQPGQPLPPPATTTQRNVKAGKGYYTIDRPIGLITVTAPRPLVEKIAVYLDNLKQELYRQITIEAKIVEVTLTETSNQGIDWTNMLKAKKIDFQLFGSSGIIYSPTDSGRVVSQVSLTNPFSMMLDFIATQGDTKVLANPKLSVMNGQPAMISVGESSRFVEKVETTVEEGVVSTSVTTNSVMDGLGMAVVATIMEDDQIVLNLTPVTSSVTKPFKAADFGSLYVQLPEVKIREMSTIVKVKNGDMLIIGGLIDTNESKDNTKVPLLGDIPGLGKIFGSETLSNTKKELVIMLQPRIL